MGGQGKTQIALKYRGDAWKSGQLCLVFWVNASSEASVVKSFGRISDFLKPAETVLIDDGS